MSRRRGGLTTAAGPRAARAGWLALCAVVVGGCLQDAIRFHRYHLGLLGDDWDFLLARRGLGWHTLLAPHNEHLSATIVLAYRVIYAFVGIRTAVPYIALLLVTVAACAALSYALVRRHLGPFVALVVPLVLVTLGPAAEGLLWPEVSTVFGALALWLAAMLALERGRPRADGLACALLILAVGANSVAVALLPATALALGLRCGVRAALRRAWVPAPAAALWLAWYVAYHPLNGHDLGAVPGYVVDSFVASVAAISGVGDGSAARALAIALLVVICARIAWLRRIPASALCMGAGLLTVWIVIGFTANALEPASESRYQFHNSTLLMAALAPLVPPFRLTLVRGAALAALAAAIVAANLGRYSPWETTYAYQESIARAEMAALTIARPAVVDPRALAFHFFEPGLLWPFSPQAYYAAIDAHGSPVSVRRDLLAAGPAQRAQADVVLVDVEGIAVVASRAPAGTIRPRGAGGAGLAPAGRGCSRIAAGRATAGFEVLAPRGGLEIRPAAGPSVAVAIARFGRPAAVGLESVEGASEALVAIRRDASSVPWVLVLTASQAVTVCSRGSTR